MPSGSRRTYSAGKRRERQMLSRSVTVTNQLGLHARAAARFVHLATRYESQIRVTRDAKVMDGKSIMGILLLAAARGTPLTISAEGPDEAEAVEALCRLVESGFGEESWSS
jgi:phosphocarrier protein HPr